MRIRPFQSLVQLAAITGLATLGLGCVPSGRGPFLQTMGQVTGVCHEIQVGLDQLLQQEPAATPELWAMRVDAVLTSIVETRNGRGPGNSYQPNRPGFTLGRNQGDPGVIYLDGSRALSEGIVTVSAAIPYPGTRYAVEINRTVALAPFRRLKAPSPPGVADPGQAGA